MASQSQELVVVTIETAPLGENTYLVYKSNSRQAIAIDPGIESSRIVEEITSRELEVVAILNTHGHGDHIGGNATLKEMFPSAPLIIGTGDSVMLTDPNANLSWMAGLEIVSPPPDRTVSEGDRLEFAGIELEVLDVPGHTPGHVAYLIRQTEPWYVFVGDVLFAGSVGRTDIPGGDGRRLLQSIREKLLTLPPETRVFPGHGPTTTVGQEKWTNPYLQGPLLL